MTTVNKQSTQPPTEPKEVAPPPEKKRLPKLSWTQAMVLMGLAVLMVLVVDLSQRAATNYRIRREAELLSQQVELARQHQAELLARRSYVASDLYVEEAARNELKWVKAGETLVVVLPLAEEIPPQANPPALETKSAADWWTWSEAAPSSLMVNAE